MRTMNFGRFALLALTVWLATFAMPGMAQTTYEEQRLSAGEVLDSPSPKFQLQALLGTKYSKFAANLTHLAIPTQLKTGGLYIEGWREGHGMKHSAALIIHPDGRLDAAYYDDDDGIVRYFSNYHATASQPALDQWVRRLGPSIKRVVHEGRIPGTIRIPEPDRTLLQEPNDLQQDALRKIAEAIWGASIADGWNYNAAVGDLLSAATAAIAKCSRAFSLVPRPAGFMPGWLYLAENFLPWVDYILGVHQDRVYKTCVSAVALDFRSAVEIASLGL